MRVSDSVVIRILCVSCATRSFRKGGTNAAIVTQSVPFSASWRFQPVAVRVAPSLTS
jgi:hypothetical protein